MLKFVLYIACDTGILEVKTRKYLISNGRKDRKDGIEVIEKAIMFATQAHEGQVRKGTDRPYIVHPLEVGRIVASMTEDEEIISAAILHDTIEDCEEITEEVICREFTKE